MINRVLEKIGLSKNEISVYVAGLEEGQIPASLLTKKTNLRRQNVYAIISKLKNKGLVAITGKKYRTRFVMQKPESLNVYLDKKEHDIDEARRDLTLVMPELRSIMQNGTTIPKINFHEGKEDMKQLFLGSLQCTNKQILAIVSSVDIYKILGKNFARFYLDERIKKKIKVKTIRIQSNEEFDDEYFHRHREHYRDLRYAPKKYNFHSTSFVYDNKVVFISSEKENFAVTIESEEYRILQECLFKSLWDVSRKKYLE